MNDRAARQYDRFVRSRDFTKANLADLIGSDADVFLAILTQVVKDMDHSKSSQSHGSALSREVLIEAMHHDVKDLNRAANSIAQEVLGFGEFFRLPTQPNPAATLIAADTMIGNLVPTTTDDAATVATKTDRQAKFIAHGFASDFVATMVMHRGQIDDTKETENKADSVGEQNTKAIGIQVSTGTKACNHLDAIFHVRYRTKRDKLGAWVCANHVEHAPKKKEEQPPTTPPTPPTP